MKSAAYPGLSWGYHFPINSRFSGGETGEPNIIVTAFVAKGMAEVTRGGLTDCRTELQLVSTFVLEALPRTVTNGGQRFGYLPSYGGSVHNANALAAFTLAEVGCLCRRRDLVEEAVGAALDVALHQRADGSWPYSEDPQGQWVDGFHTGFVLDGLRAVARAGGDEESVWPSNAA